jgi:glucokinase
VAFHYIGIDLGGTNVKAGVVDEGGRVKGHVSLSTGTGGKDLAADLVVGRMIEAAHQAVEHAGVRMADIAAAGILSPGQSSLSKGIVYRAANLPLWKNVPIRAKVSKGLGVPAILENDGNAAAHAEWWAGVGKGRNLSNLFMITLGTGVGGGLVYEGKVVRGAFDFATEIGHAIMIPGGEKCGCGQQGCLEVYCSASRTGKRATEQLSASRKLRKKSSLGKVLKEAGKVTAADVASHAKQGDAFAESVWDETCYLLAIACINISRMVDPQVIVLGGGMAAAGKFLLDSVEKQRKALWWKMTPLTAKLSISTLLNDAGVIGAAGVAKQAFEQHLLPAVGK